MYDLSGVQPLHLLSFTTNLLMLITILQKLFEICRVLLCHRYSTDKLLCYRIWILCGICYIHVCRVL